MHVAAVGARVTPDGTGDDPVVAPRAWTSHGGSDWARHPIAGSGSFTSVVFTADRHLGLVRDFEPAPGELPGGGTGPAVAILASPDGDRWETDRILDALETQAEARRTFPTIRPAIARIGSHLAVIGSGVHLVSTDEGRTWQEAPDELGGGEILLADASSPWVRVDPDPVFAEVNGAPPWITELVVTDDGTIVAVGAANSAIQADKPVQDHLVWTHPPLGAPSASGCPSGSWRPPGTPGTIGDPDTGRPPPPRPPAGGDPRRHVSGFRPPPRRHHDRRPSTHRAPVRPARRRRRRHRAAATPHPRPLPHQAG